jgi:hypothetical protein
MPELAKVLTTEDLSRRSAVSRLDLSAYLSLIDAVRRQRGVGGEVTLNEGESQRTEKRRLSLAAKEQGYRLVWRRAPPGQLRFVLAEEGQPVPGGRPRRVQAPAPQPEATGRRRKAS